MNGRDLFDASALRDSLSTCAFYTFIASMKECVDRASPSPTHRFIAVLDSKNKLLRSYTQNIDGLEEQAGLKRRGTTGELTDFELDRNVQLHGDIHRVRCTFCSAEYPFCMDHLQRFNEGQAPPCPDCTDRCKCQIHFIARIYLTCWLDSQRSPPQGCAFHSHRIFTACYCAVQ